MYANLFSCMGAAIDSKGHKFGVFGIKNGNQGQNFMSIVVIFNKNYLTEPNLP